MKIKLFACAAFLILLISAPALSQRIFNDWQTTTVNCNGVWFTFRISSEDLKNTPSWNPEKDETAPLSAQKAIEIGRKTLKQCVTNSDNWFVWNIRLTQLVQAKWFYEISFRGRYLTDCEDCNFNYFVVYVKWTEQSPNQHPIGKKKTKKLLINEFL